MSRRPIRVKLILGLSLVIAMMTLLLGGAIYGLRSFHEANLTITDQLRELGASRDLLERAIALKVPEGEADRAEQVRQVGLARQALMAYREQFLANVSRGKRAESGRDEMRQAYLIDEDLTAVLRTLEGSGEAASFVLPGTAVFLADADAEPSRGPGSVVERELGPILKADPGNLTLRLQRLRHRVTTLPGILFFDVFSILQDSQTHYISSRIIVWISAIVTLGLLFALMGLVHRWVLHPIRLLQAGVRRVGKGSFQSKIELQSRDEMQDLAEAFNDMTARLRVTYEDLEAQVRERSRQLVRSERLAGVGFLAAGVAHEINNPLASIAFGAEAIEGRLEPLLGKAPPADAEAFRRYVRMIQDEAFRCKRITEKLLDFSRCGEIHRERADLTDLVENVVEMVRHMGKYRGKTIRFDPPQQVYGHVDAQEIKQVVLNLVVNALDSMQPGGTLAIDVRESEVMAEMVFADDGHGMSQEILENIFEPFYTNRPSGKGTGLGLSISHQIVSRHQGELVAASAGVGRGATFTVRLPVEPVLDGMETRATAV